MRTVCIGMRTEGPLVVAYPLTELVAPIRTARGVGNPVSLIAGISSVSRVGRGWALEGDQHCKSIQCFNAHSPSRAVVFACGKYTVCPAPLAVPQVLCPPFLWACPSPLSYPFFSSDCTASVRRPLTS